MTRVDLKVPYSEKDEAKALGVRWDSQDRTWYIPDGSQEKSFARWLPHRQVPIYIVVGRKTCWKCKQETTVVALGIPYQLNKAGAEDDTMSSHCPVTYEALALLPRIDPMPKQLRDYLKEHYNYKMKLSKTTGLIQLNNCCDLCDALQGEFFEFEEPDGCFFITQEDDLKKLKFYEIEISGVATESITGWSLMGDLALSYARKNSNKIELV